MQDLTWQEIAAYFEKDRIAIIPIGSTEQHGPAGPLGLDTYVAMTLAEDVAQRTGVVVCPPIWYGDSSHHTDFPGTLSLRTETASLVIRDIARNLARHGFDRILVINGHKGANLPAVSTSLRNLHEEELPHVLFAVADPLHLAKSVAGKIKETNEHHAGELEMSHILYRYPNLIRTDKLTDKGVDFQKVFGGFVGGPPLFNPIFRIAEESHPHHVRTGRHRARPGRTAAAADLLHRRGRLCRHGAGRRTGRLHRAAHRPGVQQHQA